ncbi:MAG: rod shape-determining protein MreC [Lachnospiraceae bacterium]|jgi:rod shape-determining protein MreC
MKKKHNFTFKSKHIITVMTILCVSMILLTFTDHFPSKAIRQVTSYAIVPFQNGMNHVGNWLTEIGGGFQDKEELIKEKEALQKKVDELTAENSQLIQNQYELDRLQQLYSLDQQYTEYEKVAAQVISKDPGNWYSTFVINRGSEDGIAVDMNVISGSGLVGIVTKVGDHWAAVRSIIDDSSNVSAMTATTSDTCIVTGNLELMDQNKLSFIQLNDEEEKVQVGDKIVTSHISDKFLKGILIGYISEIETDANNLTRTGRLIPAVDFAHLQEVLVITTLKQQEGEES